MSYGPRTDLQLRVTVLERELASAAAVLQTALEIGKVKAIGLLEVAAGVRELAAEVERLRAEAKERDQRILGLIQERDKYRWHAEHRWAMRRELEELVGLEDGATYGDEALQKAVETVRGWKEAAEGLADRDEPITEEWLLGMGFRKVALGTIGHYELGCVRIWNFDDYWIWGAYENVEMRTRGQLADLFRWLQVPFDTPRMVS